MDQLQFLNNIIPRTFPLYHHQSNSINHWKYWNKNQISNHCWWITINIIWYIIFPHTIYDQNNDQNSYISQPSHVESSKKFWSKTLTLFSCEYFFRREFFVRYKLDQNQSKQTSHRNGTVDDIDLLVVNITHETIYYFILMKIWKQVRYITLYVYHSYRSCMK